jgi:hypothetical protein
MASTSVQAAGAVDDPVLASALSEMASEGLLNEPTGDLDTPPAGEAATGASAPTGAAPQAATDDATTDPAQAAVTPPAAGAAPDAKVEAPADPFAGTEPFTYGQGKTLEGVYRVPGEGLLVPEDRVAVIQQLATERDSLDALFRESQARTQDYDRLTTWTHSQPDGSEQTITGPEAVIAMRVQMADLAARVQVFEELVQDPQRVLGLLVQTPEGKILSDTQALEMLNLRIRDRAREVQDAVRGVLNRPTAKSASPSPSQPTSVDWAKVAPSVIDAAAKESGARRLSAETGRQTFLAGQFTASSGRSRRTIDASTRRLKVGAPIVDADFTKVVKDRIQLRTESAAQVKAAEKAGKHNAGMDKARQPAPKAAAPPKTPTTPTPPNAPKQKADWDSPLDTALAEMNITR